MAGILKPVTLKNGKATQIITTQDIPFDTRYKKWFKEYEIAARLTIGKTTYKNNHKQILSAEAVDLQHQKAQIKDKIQDEKDQLVKADLLLTYKSIQEQLLEEMTRENVNTISRKLDKIMNDGSKNALWQETRRLSRNPTLESLALKNEQGQRIYDPEGIKELHAGYFQSLYKPKPHSHHPYHTYVKTKMDIYSADMSYDDLIYNRVPTRQEIVDIIKKKKNGKSTPDVKNEMLKFSGESTINFLYPLFVEIWNNESIPSIWNRGYITCLYKGKGDKELLSNHRGITTSSAIGTILETMIDNRIAHLVDVSPAQGGGKKGSSCYDHLFLLRAIIDISIKE